MPAYAGTGLEDVHPRVHVADADNLIDVHPVVAADARELVCEGNVHSAEGVLDHLGHFRGADVRDHDFALAKACIASLYLLAYGFVVCTYRAVVVQKLINHVSGDDALRGVNDVHLLAGGFDHRADRLVDGAGGDGRFDDYGGILRANFKNLLHGLDDVARVDLFREFVVRGGDRHYVHVGILVLRSEGDASSYSRFEEFFQAFFFKGRLALIQGRNQFLIVVGSYHFLPVRSEHQGRRQADVSESDDVDHFLIDTIVLLTIFFAFWRSSSLHHAVPNGFQRWG